MVIERRRKVGNQIPEGQKATDEPERLRLQAFGDLMSCCTRMQARKGSLWLFDEEPGGDDDSHRSADHDERRCPDGGFRQQRMTEPSTEQPRCDCGDVEPRPLLTLESPDHTQCQTFFDH